MSHNTIPATEDKNIVSSLKNVEKNYYILAKPSWARAGVVGVQGIHREMQSELKKTYPGLTSREAGEYVAAYEVKERPLSTFQTQGRAPTLETFYTQEPGKIMQEHTTDMVLTPDDVFTRVPLEDRGDGGDGGDGGAAPAARTRTGRGGTGKFKGGLFKGRGRPAVGRRGLYV